MKKIYFLIAVCFSFSFNLMASIDHTKSIQGLLEAIESSQAMFERNGQLHSAQDAKHHLERKWKQAKRWRFQREEITAQEFIEKIASRSSMSGKDYYIILSDGTRLTMTDWFTKIQSSNATEI